MFAMWGFFLIYKIKNCRIKTTLLQMLIQEHF